MFSFNEVDTRIFNYSRGERNEDGTFKSLFADPAKIKRQLEISLPNMAQLIDQHLRGEMVKQAKRQALYAAEKARELDPTLPEPQIDYSEDDNVIIRMGGIAHEKICNGVRQAFDLLPFDEATGHGCTDFMVVAVMNYWQEWLEKKDGSTPDSPTTVPPSPVS